MSSNEVGNKYKVLDAETGTEKQGKYFCLRLDANDPKEREIVNTTLWAYAVLHFKEGNREYAYNVMNFIGGEPASEFKTVFENETKNN